MRRLLTDLQGSALPAAVDALESQRDRTAPWPLLDDGTDLRDAVDRFTDVYGSHDFG